MASKGTVRKIVDAALGPAVGAVVAVLFATPLDSGADTLAGMAMKVLPRLALGVAAGVATFFAIRLLTFLGRKVRPWFRTPATKLKALVPEIEDLYHYDQSRTASEIMKDRLFGSRHLQRREELGAELSKLGIPSPAEGKGSFTPWRTFLHDLYGCAIRGDVKGARMVNLPPGGR